MEAIIKHLEDALNECSKKINELNKDKKEYEAKFKKLSEVELELKSKMSDIDTREKKVKYIENIAEYNQQLNVEAKSVREASAELVKAQRSLQTERAEFESLKSKSLQEIENLKTNNLKQQEALIEEKKNVEKEKETARKIINSVR